MTIAPQHLLSLSRVVLGGLILSELLDSNSSPVVLPAVAAACVADWLDGRVAREHGAASMRGRLIDNLSDAVFLALAFAGFAVSMTWSLPLVGSATRYWEHANWLPLVALVGSFGSYMLRWAVCSARDWALEPSLRGHTAGVANYALALLGGIAVIPGFDMTPWLLEPAFVTVALLNVSAVTENLGLLLKAALR